MLNYANVDLYFAHYCNYYDRIVKRKLPSDLRDVVTWPTLPIKNVKNFNPADEVDSVQILTLKQSDLIFNPVDPDYLFVTNAGDTEVQQRWFVIDCDRSRVNQWICRLRRDVIGEEMEKVLRAPAYIRKGWVVDGSDPAIYNSEDLEVNQIKMAQYPLRDAGYYPWIVGYIDKAKDQATDITLQVGPKTTGDIQLSSLSNIAGYGKNYPDGAYSEESCQIEYIIHGKKGTVLVDWLYLPILRNWGRDAPLYKDNDDIGDRPLRFDASPPQTTKVTNSDLDTWDTLSKGYAPIIYGSDIAKLQSYDGRTIYDMTSEKLYSASVSVEKVTTKFAIPAGSLFDAISQKLSDIGIEGTPNTKSFTAEVTGDIYKLELTEIERKGSVTVTIPAARTPLSDAPYDLFAIPYATTELQLGNVKGSITQADALNYASGICEKLGSSIYDCQIVPYCPFTDQQVFGSSAGIRIAGTMAENKDYSWLKAGESNVGIIMFASSSSYTKGLGADRRIRRVYGSAYEKKVSMQTEIYRISSPNYASSFEFSPAKNDGVTRFTATFTLKPGIPYIRIYPDFGGLYGSSFKDNRGLILGGDFSISRTSNAYQEYILQNKNFENIFNRQIEHLGITQTEEMKQRMFSAIAGTVTGAAGGAITGGQIGGAAGAAVGATVGGVASAIGGAMDIAAARRLNAEAISYQTDMYNFSLQNVKARPNTLSKVSAYSVDNALLPFVEVYSCTETEKAAVEAKMKYSGMTIMRIGRILDFLNPEGMTFIQADLIRAEGIHGDAHWVNTIAEELKKGVFIE